MLASFPQNLHAAPQYSNLQSVRNIYASSDSRDAFVVYRDAKSNVSFGYPQGWHVQPDKDCLAKFNGTSGDGTFGEVRLGMHEGIAEPEAVSHIMLTGLSKALPGFKEVSTDKIRFGNHMQYTGKETLISGKIGEAEMYQRWVFFSTGSNVFSLSFACPADAYKKMLPTFDRVLTTVNGALLSPPSSAANSSVGPTSLKMATYSDKAKRITFLYPEGWEVHPGDPGKEVDVKFAGKNSQGMGAELAVSGMLRPPYMSIEQFAATYEDTYLKPLKNCHKLTSKTDTIGLSHNEGVQQSWSFEAEGHKARQSAAFFADSSRYYAIVLTSAYWKDNETEDIFQRVISSVKTSE
jgi:hypothetical protein